MLEKFCQKQKGNGGEMRPAIVSGIVNGPGTHWSAIRDPLQQAIHMVQNRHAGEQKSHWDKTNKT